MESEEKEQAEEPEQTGGTERLEQQVEELALQIDHILKHQIAVKDEQINILYTELDGYRKDAAGRYVDQVMKEIIAKRTEMRRLMHSEQWEALSAEELRKEYGYVFEDLTSILERQNIDPFSSERGTPFDAAKHKVGRVEATDKAVLNKLIKDSMAEGYTKNGKVFIPERVVVLQAVS